MVLWEKESKNADAYLVDLFANNSQMNGFNEWNQKLRSSDWKNQFLGRQIDPKKCNKVSNAFCLEGNIYFSRGQWIEAMELYTQSLRFAEPGTNSISFAYANRALCFSHLKLYTKCLRDIELAMQANFPHIMDLMQQKIKCEAEMKRSFPKQKPPFEPKLSFNPNEKFPCMADVMEIQQNNEFGCHVIAKCDIDVGQTVLVEERFVSIACADNRMQCDTCLQAFKNFIACSNCTDVMFCSEKCRNQNEFHRKFCGAAVHRMPNDVKFIAKSILTALIAFESADELMAFVENALSKRCNELPAAANNPKSNYGLFLNLQPSKKEVEVELVYKTFTALLDLPLVKNMFRTEKSQRFLMHLIGEHFLIITYNSCGGSASSQSTMRTLANVFALFHHAWEPNLFNSSIGNTQVCITMRPIKKGDQLFVKHLFNDATANRNDATTHRTYGSYLRSKKSTYRLCCKCDKYHTTNDSHCEPADSLRMQSDPSYRALNMSIGQDNLSTMKTECELFLKKYGHYGPWSEECGFVLKQYTKCLLNDFPSF